jgi:hypothetical protein
LGLGLALLSEHSARSGLGQPRVPEPRSAAEPPAARRRFWNDV